ncbi:MULTISPECIES: DNA-processing protein DprA [unclassified Arthrobacter]|uniref:DNA-processing protein DprA n=1 Tax=unclassified Arthrobacter TaxID=235627 RepID=UPI001E615928|nr:MULTISPECIES: DNA-processing protein DprA [unclassified Arthrobacter]MCC9145710.1 DNA-processing protein DprA [Arthrobacter sp. zg-Y919]MDK1276939.1 DNA-processing protein DprA [Arthrobacter sp. zg.Y919]WIB04130.1 DNA-processing protein DprA [Arthrobacter sp. zg-Y919]
MSIEEVLTARAALSRLFEPSDMAGLALVAATGPVHALQIATGRSTAPGGVRAEIATHASSGGSGQGDALAEGLQRWKPRVADLAPDRDLETIRRLGGELLVPEDPRWPEALLHLELGMPLCLWVRGTLDRGLPALGRTVAVVGSRDATGYGLSIAGDISAGLANRGFTVVSGGAYGIDAQAHRSALASAPAGTAATIAVMAGGADRFYPAGNEDLLRAVASRGVLLSEVPPGSAPTRWRFLQRNRIIAALSAVTVVVEARWRSGALNTAHHAAGLGREVGAVPGSVYSANSAGCHRLLRDGSAVCVTDAGEVAELAGPFGSGAAAGDAPGDSGGREGGGRGGASGEKRSDHDGLAVQDLLLLDALPVRNGTTVDKLASVAGLSPPGVRAGLARLELEGLAVRSEADLWRRSRR